MKVKKFQQPFFIVLFLFASCFVKLHAQVSGCKDPNATNYNTAATVNDGSCTYNITSYTPPVKVDPLSSTLIETSGLQMAGNFLWSFNDGLNPAAIYRMDTLTNTILQTVNLGGAANVDWEDIAFDGTYFYIGDFGNNANGDRTDLKIYKFPFSAIPDYNTDPVVTIASAQIEILNYSYADQVPVVATGANNTKFDCEAMIVENGIIHLFSKNWIDVNTTHYVINSIAAGTYVAAPIETLATNYLVTAADKVPGQNIIVLLGYQNGFPGNHYMHVLSDFSAGLFFNGNKRRLDLPNAGTMGQAEGICFRNSTYGYISNERISSPITITQKLRSFNIAGFLPPYLFLLPLDLTNFNVINRDAKQQISWSFSTPVTNLQILHSSDRSNFYAIQKFSTATNGSFNYTASTSINCYKLTWKQADGSNRFSNTICLNAAITKNLYNIVLHNNGQLQVLSRSTDNCLFRIVSTDGRMLAQSTAVTVVSGTNTVGLGKPLTPGSLVILQVIGNKMQFSVLLQVAE